MIPKRVTLENFLSFGEKQEIVFEEDHILWIIGGPNGSGKSTVFDAMTYCLFGTHRASGTRIKESDNHLIRHGCGGFQIGFEFEFQGIDYRIVRSRNRGSKRQPTPTVERRTREGKWERIPHVNTITELDAWVVRTLGLECDQFEASVLLRQGKADAFVDAKPSERFEILQGIIQMEQYEKLAMLAGEKLSEASRTVKSLQKQLEGKTLVTPEQLAAAELQVTQKEAEKKRCEVVVQQATANQERARQWNKLQADRVRQEARVQQAKKLEAQAEQIEQNYRRWKHLSETLPRLKSLIELQARLDCKQKEHTQIQAAIREQEQQREHEAALLKKWTEELQQQQATLYTLEQQLTQRATDGKELSNKLQAAKELSDLEQAVQTYAEVVEQNVQTAREIHAQAVYTQANAKDEVTRRHTIFGQAQEYHHRIGKLSVGVNCSACGQPVTAEHAEKERQQATARLTEAKQALEAAEQRLSHANQELQRHAEALQQLQSQWQAKTQALLKLETSRRNYQHYGALEPPAELEKQVLALREKYQQEREQLLVVRNRLDALEALQKKSEAHVQKWTQQLEQKKNDQQKLNTETATLTGQLQSTREQLPEVLHSASTADVDPLMRELQTLTQCQIEKQFQELSESRHQFALLQQQMQDIENKLNEIPETARLRSEEAEQLLQLATHDKSKAEQEWQHARDQHQSLRREAEVYKNASSELAHMEHRQRLLKLLDEKLGKKGLQLAMMQDAQVQIVELARQTLLQLSNHELSLELNPPDGDTADQALDLCVRHAESAHVTPMEYLSGSQKFRVAIAIALAIGRYAAGQSRPLESVIIDEGFGSLDREGLQAMAEELLELQRSQLLRRIILVSHQEEFADRFAAGYTLSPSEQGTQVKAWRR